MPRLSLGLGVQNIRKVGGGAAPSGIPVASTNTIIVVDTEIVFHNFSGTYEKEGPFLYRYPSYNIIFWTGEQWIFREDDMLYDVFATPPSNNVNYIATTGWPTQTLTAA